MPLHSAGCLRQVREGPQQRLQEQSQEQSQQHPSAARLVAANFLQHRRRRCPLPPSKTSETKRQMITDVHMYAMLVRELSARISNI